jgi:hypothetical protein
MDSGEETEEGTFHQSRFIHSEINIFLKKRYFLFSSLVFGSFKKLSVLVLAHLLLAPLYNIAHSCTSILITS